MILHIFNERLERIGKLITFQSLIWEEFYRDIGKFTLITADSPHNISILRRGNIIYHTGSDTAMRISYTEYNTAEKTVMVAGFTTLELLAQRCQPTPITITNAEQGMYRIVRENLRGLPVELAEPIGLSETFHTEVIGQIEKELQRIAAKADLGYIMRFDHRAEKHVFCVYKGLDRTWGQYVNPPQVFSAERKNLSNMLVVNDDSLYYNIAYVRAEFQTGQSRLLIVSPFGDFEGLDRHEWHVPLRISLERTGQDAAGNPIYESTDSLRVTQEMMSKGLEELNKRLKIQTFTADVDPKDWRVKYHLGDMVTCKSNRYNLRFDARIMHCKEVTENNQTVITLTLGEPQYTKFDEVKLYG